MKLTTDVTDFAIGEVLSQVNEQKLFRSEQNVFVKLQKEFNYIMDYEIKDENKKIRIVFIFIPEIILIIYLK